MCKKLTLILISILLLSAVKAQQVTLYQDCNYRGYSVTLGPGYYSASQHGMRIRELSSITIPPGVVVNLFAEDQFNGHYISLTSSSACLLNERFNDQMVSLQILSNGYGYGENPSPVILYNRCGYQGKADFLQEGNYSTTTLGIMTVQSIKVAPGYAVIFRKERRNGLSTFVTNEEIRDNNSCLTPFWASTVRSAYVYRLSNLSGDYWNHNNPELSHFSQGAVVYGDINFSGRAQALAPGAYRSYQLYYVGQNNISSIRIAPGYRALAYDGENFTGASIEIRNNVSNLHQSYWGNRIGSLVIEKLGNVIINPVPPPPPPPTTIPFNAPKDKVTVYQHNLYRGASYSFLPGSYTGRQLYVVGERNISSIVVPQGFTVTAYMGSNFDGPSRIINNSISDFAAEGQGWNDKISSMVISFRGSVGGTTNPPPPPPPPVRPQPVTDASAIMVTAYGDVGYRGAAQVFQPGRYASHQLSGVGVRTISSIKVPPGYKVTVYDGPNFTGDWRVLTYSIDNFVAEGQGKWNDRIASMIVERI